MRFAAVVVGLVLLNGCGGSSASKRAPTFEGTELLSVESREGTLNIGIRTDPQPPTRGSLFVEYTLSALDGGSADDLTLDVTPWMISMGHGTSVKPTVEPQGGGVYILSNVELFMPGQWELRTHIDGPISDDAAPQIQIP